MDHILIGRGKAGWHSTGLSHGNQCSSSGGSLEHYLAEAKDGTWIYDAEEAEDRAFVRWVIAGPMFNPLLKPEEISSFSSEDKKTLLGLLPGLGGAMQTLAVMTLGELSYLDYVGLEVYLAGLREIPGLKVGRVYNHQIVWES